MTRPIDYQSLVPRASNDYAKAAACLAAELPVLWLDAYAAGCEHEPNVLQVDIDGFEHLFDFTSDPSRPEALDAPEDRLVGVFGLSHPPDDHRDASRIRGFVGGRLHTVNGPADKGHFIAHSAGGGLDINLFPQRPELNRGHSADGRIFRRMERFAAYNPGTFVFARPIYTTQSWTPCELEYGLLMPELAIWVERFTN